MRSPLIIGTRGSELALWQANYVKDLLHELGYPCELKIIKTQGDNMQELSPDKMEGKGFFTKEIEDALLREETDIAVHSFKDLPTESPAGLYIAAVSEREDPSELFLVRKEALDPKKKFGIKIGGHVGTSSARRKSQLLAFRPDLKVTDMRGNVPTRLNKLREGMYDGIMLAFAGVERLGLNTDDFFVEKLSPEEIIPAPAQGIVAIQVRESDKALHEILKAIDNREVRIISELERKVLNLFQGGCQTPVGVYATYDEEREIYSVRASKSKAWDKSPVSVYSESKDPQVLPTRIVGKINSVKPCSVFITRNPRKESYLKNVLTGNGFSLEEKSLIEMKPVTFGPIPNCEWIFFSSKHAVKFFFDQKPDITEQKFACVGKATADALRQYGKRASFIGASADTRMTGKQFASLTGNAKVLFPQAKGSLKSIQQQMIKSEFVVDLIVYETLKRNDGEMPVAEIVVFTSPSNVDAWFENYTFSKQQKAVAMGDATANALKMKKVYASALVDVFDDTGIARAVFGSSAVSDN